MLSNYVQDNHTNKRPMAFKRMYVTNAVDLIRVIYIIYVRVSRANYNEVGVVTRS